MEIRTNATAEMKRKICSIPFLFFLANLCTLVIAFSTFLVVPHYSTDTYNNFVSSASNVEVNIRHGRYVTAGIYKLFELFHFDYGQHTHLGSFFLLLVLAGGVAALAKRFYALSKSQTFISFLAIDVVLLSLSLNLSMMEILLFPDTVFSGSVCYLFLYLAVLYWCKAKRRWYDYLLSLLFLCLNLDMYQVCIGFYIIVCLAYTFVRERFIDGKKIVLYTSINLAIGLAASLQSLFFMKLPQLLGTSTTEYVSSSSLSDILNNAKQIVDSQIPLLFGFSGFLPKFAPAVFFGAAIFLLAFQFVKHRVPAGIILLCVLGFAGSWFMAYAPYFIAETVWMPPRTLISLFALIAFPGIWGTLLGNHRCKNAFIVIYASFMLTMAVSIQRVSINNVAGNKIDQEIAGIITHKIEEYETSSGQTITTIAVHIDSQITPGYSSIEYTIFDTNIRSFVKSWSDVSSLEYYSGRDFTRKEMSQEEYLTRFGEKNWDYFDSTEQIQFDGTTMYWVVY